MPPSCRRQPAGMQAPDPPTAQVPLMLPPPPPPPPSMEQQRTFQASLPPFQPPHGQLTGHPPAGSQYRNYGLATNAPQPYAHPYGAPFYPPVYPPVQYPQFIPGPGQPQPWEYYPMGHLLPPVLHPVATHPHNNRLAPANETMAPVFEDMHAHTDKRGKKRGESGHTTVTSTQTVQPKKVSPNKLLGPGIYEFMVDVSDDGMIRMFSARTDMQWSDFLAKATSQFKAPRDIRLGYRFGGNGEARAMSQLDCEFDWDTAMKKMKEKAQSARTRAVKLELKNLRQSPSTRKGKKREKQCRDDDVPPEPSLEVKDQLACLEELQDHMKCKTHSSEGVITYCWNKPAGKDTPGGHREYSHADMTLWAKHMSLKKTNKHWPPNSIRFDCPPTKKKKGLGAKPEIHIAMNITPAPGAGGDAMGSYLVSASPIPLLASAPGGVSGNTQAAVTVRTQSQSAPPTSVPHGPCNPPAEFKPLLFLLDRAFNGVVPSIHDLLTLMDCKEPTNDLKYIDALSDLQDMGISDSLDLNTLGVIHLAAIGSLGRDRARRLYQYNYEKVIVPLGLMETNNPETHTREAPSVQEVVAATQAVTEQAVMEQAGEGDVEKGKGKGRLIKEESFEVILEWLDGIAGRRFETIKEETVEDLVQEVDELESWDSSGSESDVATPRQSQEV